MVDGTLVYSDAVLDYDFGPHHPLQPIRYKLTRDLLAAYGALEQPGISTREPPVADEAIIELVHDRRYISAVKALGHSRGHGSAFEYGLGTGDNPVFPDMHEATAAVVGGSVDGARQLLAGETRCVFNLAGGLHHAMPGRASGFCIYNDPAVAIAWMLEQGVDRVAYLDTDAHHGDGVQWIFYDEPRVLTVSVHESGRTLFPGTGFVDELGEGAARGTSLNVPLAPYASDSDVLLALDAVLLPRIRAFRPDVLVVQHGADGHHLDPLTHLSFSINVFPEVARRERALADDVCAGRILGGGGGGYAYREVVPRAWTSVFAVLAGIELPDRLPEEWRRDQGFPVPETLSDPDSPARAPLESTKQTLSELEHQLADARGIS